MSFDSNIPHFRTTETPPEVRIAVWKKQLSTEEAYMLGTIDALTQIDKKTGEIKPCYASNLYLGKCQGIKEDQASAIISHLKKKGWVKQVGFDGRIRHLITSHLFQQWRALRVGINQGAAPGKIPSNGLPTVNLESNNTVSLCSTESSMFFKVEKESPASQFDHRMAVRLFEALQAKRKVSKKSSTKKWATEFTKLRKLFSKTEIKTVLEWYIPKIGEPYIHEAYSAKAFRTKFPNIQSAMTRKVPAKQKQLPQTAPGKRALEYLENFNWPGDVGTDLPQAVEQSIVNWKAAGAKVLAKMKAYDGKARDPFVRLLTSMSHLWLDIREADFAFSHFQHVHKKLAGWNDFNGRLSSYAWSHDQNTPGGKMVFKLYKQFIKDYTLEERVEPLYKQLTEFFDEN